MTNSGMRATTLNLRIVSLWFFFGTPCARDEMKRHMPFRRAPRKLLAGLRAAEVCHPRVQEISITAPVRPNLDGCCRPRRSDAPRSMSTILREDGRSGPPCSAPPRSGQRDGACTEHGGQAGGDGRRLARQGDTGRSGQHRPQPCLGGGVALVVLFPACGAARHDRHGGMGVRQGLSPLSGTNRPPPPPRRAGPATDPPRNPEIAAG